MLGDDVDVIVDGGTVAGRRGLHDRRRRPGTPGRVLRLGALSLEQLNAVLEPLGAVARRTRADDAPCGSTSSSSWSPPSVTYLLTVVAREIALRTGAVAEVRDRDVHAEPIPYLGGLAMLGGPGRGVPRRPRAAVPVRPAGPSSSTTPASC